MSLSNLLISSDTISISNSAGQRCAELNLMFMVGSVTYQVVDLIQDDRGWTASTNDKNVTVRLEQLEHSLCVELCGDFGPGQEVIYFHQSPIHTSHVHAFIPDEHNGTFPVGQKRTFTLTNQASLRKTLGLKEEFWMVAPQPHVFFFADIEAGGFGVSIPECLPADATQFAFHDRRMQIRFLHHVAACDGGRMPRVYLDLDVASGEEMLERHLGHARRLGLVRKKDRQPQWWHNPLYCTWGDQCYHALHGLHTDDSLTRDRILGWADKIRGFYSGEVNLIVDAGYSPGLGDFSLRPQLFADTAAFRSLIDELKARNFRVILWYTPIWVVPHIAVVKEHPEWLLHRHDGSILDESGDWKGKFHFDWSHPEVREFHAGWIRRFLQDYGVDGFKIDLTYANPPTREVLPFDPGWAAGNQVLQKMVEFIHAKATTIRPDVFLTVNGVDCALQPYVSAVRLNDLFNFTDASAWYKRAELVNRLMPEVAVDVDGWPAAPSKLREYPFVASVFGAPVSYHLDGTDGGDFPINEGEINRMAAVWNTYANAPIESGDVVNIQSEKGIFERRGSDGVLRALSLSRSVFITFAATIRLAANADLAVAVPLENGRKVSRASQILRDGTRSPMPFHTEQDRVLLYVEDSAKGILFYELE